MTPSSRELREIVASGRGWLRRLGSTQQWITNQGMAISLKEMDERYLINCEAFMLRNAGKILVLATWGDAFGITEWESELREKHDIPLLIEETEGQDPVTWIRTQPIMLGIRAELRARERLK